MNTNIFIPETIKVGFQNRNDTYTQKLAYVIYYDNKGVLRKEKSWEGWRDKKIPDVSYSNVPMSGFVLNKKVGGYSTGWNHRQTYVRIYDPRDFEFEITVPNLLYILENTNSIKGKGLEGEFVYGWDGTDLVLIPTDSPDYVELSELNNLRHQNKSFTGKDLMLGGTYLSNYNRELVYLGRFYEYNKDKKESKTYFFYDSQANCKIVPIKTLTGNIIDVVDETCVDNYADLMDVLFKSSLYSAREPTFDEFTQYVDPKYWSADFYVKSDDGKYVRVYLSFSNTRWNTNRRSYDVRICNYSETILYNATLEQIYNKLKPKYLVTYNSNKEKIKEFKNGKS